MNSPSQRRTFGQNRNAPGQNPARRDRWTKTGSPGAARPGAGGGAAGDLYVRVRLAKNPDFEVEDHNLIYEAELAPWEAVLGMNLSVPALDGRVNMKIPPGTQNGQKLRGARPRLAGSRWRAR